MKITIKDDNTEYTIKFNEGCMDEYAKILDIIHHMIMGWARMENE